MALRSRRGVPVRVVPSRVRIRGRLGVRARQPVCTGRANAALEFIETQVVEDLRAPPVRSLRDAATEGIVGCQTSFYSYSVEI